MSMIRAAFITAMMLAFLAPVEAGGWPYKCIKRQRCDGLWERFSTKKCRCRPTPKSCKRLKCVFGERVHPHLCKCVKNGVYNTMVYKFRRTPKHCPNWYSIWDKKDRKCDSGTKKCKACPTGQEANGRTCKCLPKDEVKALKATHAAMTVCRKTKKCKVRGQKWDESTCACRFRQKGDCGIGKRWSVSNGKGSCVLRKTPCPKTEEKWSASLKRCVRRRNPCPKITERWNAVDKKCEENPCPNPKKRWSASKKACVDKKNRCKKGQLWSIKASKCIDDPCPEKKKGGMFLLNKKCLDAPCKPNHVWSVKDKKCVSTKCQDSTTRYSARQNKCVKRKVLCPFKYQTFSAKLNTCLGSKTPICKRTQKLVNNKCVARIVKPKKTKRSTCKAYQRFSRSCGKCLEKNRRARPGKCGGGGRWNRRTKRCQCGIKLWQRRQLGKDRKTLKCICRKPGYKWNNKRGRCMKGCSRRGTIWSNKCEKCIRLY